MTDAALLRKHGWVSVRVGDAQCWSHERLGRACTWTQAVALLAHDLDAALDDAKAKRGGA